MAIPGHERSLRLHLGKGLVAVVGVVGVPVATLDETFATTVLARLRRVHIILFVGYGVSAGVGLGQHLTITPPIVLECVPAYITLGCLPSNEGIENPGSCLRGRVPSDTKGRRLSRRP